MCIDPKQRTGGALASGMRMGVPLGEPLRFGADVSWLPRCRVGDNQGSDGACVIFAFASWAEIVHGYIIADEDCHRVYQQTLARLHRPDGGLTFEEGFEAARAAMWLPGASGILQVPDLTLLVDQPILGAYEITPAWDRTNAAGCLDHRATGNTRGLHAVVVVAHGELEKFPSVRWVYVENSWGREWGWNGVGVMSESLHQSLCSELWTVV